MAKRILIMAGGTGGHIFPGLAVADTLAAEGWHVDWLGTSDRMEAELVPQAGYPIHFVKIQGVRNKGWLRKLMTPINLIKAIWQAKKIIKTCRPDVIAGFGGYVSLPGGLAAKLAGVPLMIHEQNAYAGLSNRLLARFAQRTLCAFDGTQGLPAKTRVVGNPVRANILACGDVVKNECIRILVVGGSLGAQALNQAVPAALTALTVEQQQQIKVQHQTGKQQNQAVQQAYQTLASEVEVSEFITDMASAYQQADLIICRAGALTVSEISAVGRAAIFVPLPHAVDDHQTKNAQVLVRQGAAYLVPQADLVSGKLVTILDEILADPERLHKMAQAAKHQAKANAHNQIAFELKELSVGKS
ncbi:undecaprenyldiphospho-muramoylpentapeptide beta-N-acetylglucosaminyltransferase [Gayadomonas joobiniege]|uniref:undecaprenyldiphospho-muramoylpentapeptide beta-N-acetylglucosaminyltransferase n=1 Tax=Gayadomonas joobiniege TaxID=1234606 RepID=UPI000373C12F|nr:undecaprenyldiphospho-muramoylpentapeptide beta-N-acetylglucosaminyltransferase [Gayadomonas joobiniege]